MLYRLKLVGMIFLLAFNLNAQQIVTSFNTLIDSTVPLGLTNPVFNEGSPMSYDPSQVATKGAAFSLTYNNQGGTSFDGYPSGKIGSVKVSGTYYVGDPAVCGMPVQIKDLDHSLRINWDTFQQNANDIDDKWWATINVIFDSGLPDEEPDPLVRDYDLVIQHVSYEQDDFSDEPSDGNGRYWYFARDTITKEIKPFSLYLNDSLYQWAVRYKFFKFPDNDAKSYQNDKVHIKFIPINNNDTIPYFDHSLKTFIDATKEYLQYLKLTDAERILANEKVADPDLWIKGLAAGYEVYEGNSILGNEFFYVVLDSIAPSSPQNLQCNLAGSSLDLDWDDVLDSDRDHYAVYRSTNWGSFEKVADSLRISEWKDLDISTANNYRYFVRSVDRSLNESLVSDTCSLDCLKPDLLITEAKVVKYGSDYITAHVKISNIGTSNISNLANVALGIHGSADAILSSEDNSYPVEFPVSGTILPGDTVGFDITINMNWQSGKHFTLFSIDDTNVLDECDESNNMFPLLVMKCSESGALQLSGTLSSGIYASNDTVTILPNTVFSDNILVLGRSITGLPTSAFDKQNVNLQVGTCQ